MNVFKKALRASSLRFLVMTILTFLAIKYFFLAYAGLTIEGGSLYSRFLAEHFNIISWFRNFLLWGGGLFAGLLGYTNYHTEYFLVIPGGSAVKLVYSCLALDLIAAYASLVMAWPAKRLSKVASALIGIVIIIFLNMIRLGGLAVLYSTGNYSFFESIDQHDLFNIIMLVVVFVMFVVHVKYTESKFTKKIG